MGWRALAKLLAGEHGAGWRRLFGFSAGETPSEAGLRYFFNTVGAEACDELVSLFIDLLQEAGLLPKRSTFPGDPPERGVTISHDLMLHDARSNVTVQHPLNLPRIARKKQKISVNSCNSWQKRA